MVDAVLALSVHPAEREDVLANQIIFDQLCYVPQVIYKTFVTYLWDTKLETINHETAIHGDAFARHI